MRALSILALSLCLASCATSHTSPSPQPTVIAGAELRTAQSSNLYDAINQLRPAFFASRGATSFINEPRSAILVIVDRTVRGGLEELRDIDARLVRSVRRLTAADVYQITGRSAPSGGVEVVFGP